jgi:hypothetical protein
MRTDKNYYYIVYLMIFILLSLSTIKAPGGLRVSQLLIIGTFFSLLIVDFADKKNDYKILLFFITGAAVMSLISLNSIHGKVGEIKFLVKYFLIFPATFYVGAKMIQKIPLSTFAKTLEIVAFLYVLVAYMIYFLPIPPSILDLVVHYREGFGGIHYLDFQGTFFEAGWFALAVFSTLASSIFIRYEFNIWPKKLGWLYGLYLFSFSSLLLSKNKTIWIAIILITLILVIYKGVVLLLYTNRYQPKNISYDNPTVKLFSKINSFKIISVVILFVLILFIVNETLPQPIVSAEMIQEKMEHERGKAFSVVMDMIKNSGWFGGYGFGFVEYYFSTVPMGILGLGEGAGMIFNSYLDIWLSASILGLIFHIMIVYICLSSSYYITMVIPLLFLIFANFNPAIGDEYYYLFMGISYGIIQKYVKQRYEYA